MQRRLCAQISRIPANLKPQKPSGPKSIRESHCRADRQTTETGRVDGRPGCYNWTPQCFDDLSDSAEMGCACEMHHYLESIHPRTCDMCRSRWLRPTMLVPTWADSSIPSTLTAISLRVTEPGNLPQGPFRGDYCVDDPLRYQPQTTWTYAPLSPSWTA